MVGFIAGAERAPERGPAAIRRGMRQNRDRRSDGGERPLDVVHQIGRVLDADRQAQKARPDAEFGPRLHDRDPAACCRMRKVEPLRAALEGYEAWVTGVRRDEGPTRADTPLVTFDEQFGLVKVNPLAAWTFDEVVDHAVEHRVPVNLLLSDGYPSIGCEPCTQRVEPGADPRSGRWTGFAKTECGLHP